MRFPFRTKRQELSAVRSRFRLKSAICALTGSVALSSCITVSGPTEKDLKSAILDSYSVQSVGWFYPQGVPSDVTTYIAPTPEAQAAVSVRIAETSKSLAKLHKARRAAIEKLLRAPVSPEASSKIRMVDKPNPVAMIGPNGEIQLSYLMLQSVLRGALLEDVIDKSEPFNFGPFGDDESKYVFNDGLQPEKATAEQQRGLAELVDLIAQARATKGRGALGTVASIIGDDDLDSPWFKLADLEDGLSELESSYAGALLFLLAHEQGHLVLGHYQQLNSQLDMTSYCKKQLELEEQADDYALILLSLIAGDTPIPDWFYAGRSGATTGYKSFLQYSYPLARFKQGAGCTYPTNKERFERLAVRHKALQDQAHEAINKAYEDAVSKALRKAQSEIEQQPKN